MPDIFLSYSRQDQAVARRYADALKQEGFDVWWDATLKSGQAYDRVTETALREAKAVVVLWSKQSVNSDWVRAEATIGQRNKTLTPVMIEDCVRPVMFELTQTSDLSRWKGDRKDPAWRSFIQDVRHVIASEPAGNKPTANTAAAVQSGKTQPNRTTLFAGLAVALVAVIGGGYWFMRMSASSATAEAGNAATSAVVSGVASTTTLPAVTEPVLTPDSLAVLPFANLSPDTNDSYVASGLHDEVLNQLGKLSKLKVISRQSVLRFADSKLSTPEIAKELRVANVMTGTVRFANNRIRVSAQLIDARTDKQLWSDTFDIKFADIFDAEAQIAMNVANAMRVSFSEEERKQIEKIPTTSPQAYALYLKSKSLGEEAVFGSSAATEQAQQSLDQAIALDPGFAQAYVEKASVALNAQQFNQAREYLHKALALDPDLPVSEGLEVSLLNSEGKFAEALPLAQSMLEKRPNSPRALRITAAALTGVGDYQKAWELAERRVLVEQTPDAYQRAGEANSWVGRNAQALEYFRKEYQLNPPNTAPYLLIAFELAALGNKQEAIGWINTAKDSLLGPKEDKNAGPNLYAALIYANALAGRSDEARRLFILFQKNGEATADLPTKARAYISAGELEQGLALLKQMIKDKRINTAISRNAYLYLKLNVHHLPALDRPEFVEVRKQL